MALNLFRLPDINPTARTSNDPNHQSRHCRRHRLHRRGIAAPAGTTSASASGRRHQPWRSRDGAGRLFSQPARHLSGSVFPNARSSRFGRLRRGVFCHPQRRGHARSPGLAGRGGKSSRPFRRLPHSRHRHLAAMVWHDARQPRVGAPRRVRLKRIEPQHHRPSAIGGQPRLLSHLRITALGAAIAARLPENT